MTTVPSPGPPGRDNPFPSSEGSQAAEYPQTDPGEIRASRAWLIGVAPAVIPLLFIVLIVVTLASYTNLASFSVTNFFGPIWNPEEGQFGTQTLILGTMVTAVPALIVAMLIALGVAIASVVYLPRSIARVLDPFVDLLAGIPSIVFAIWGFLFLAPFFGKSLFPWINQTFGWIPGFGPPLNPTGLGILLAGTVLTLMVLPITTVLIRDALRTVPRDLWESGLALGATRWEVTRRISLRYAGRGVWAAGLLGFARATGEAVAVYYLIGSVAEFPPNAYGSSASLASTLIQWFDQSFLQPTILTPLVEIAFLLVAISLVANVLGRWATLNMVRSGVTN